VWIPPRRPGALAALVRHTITNRHGVVAGDRLTAHRIELSMTQAPLRVWQAAITAARSRLPALTTPSQPAAIETLAMRRRIAVIRDRIARDTDTRYQASLFDGRADAEATARRLVIARLDRALARVLEAIDTGIDARRSRVELVAAWPERRR
jgi:hypothetical protein